ncbi:MAG: hypothetical protein K940chlam5_00502 [Candidatus Anoxychlamydiales bacterium]|nr:hypothetical protein [Candidatus Anoxychlamydiales bacterium]
MTFLANQSDRIVDPEQVYSCLVSWQKLIEETGRGTMTVVKDGKFTEIKVSVKQDSTVKNFFRLSDIKLYNQYRHISEGQWMCREESKHYNLEISGNDADAQPVKVSFYINHTSECSEPWFKTLNVKLV